MLQETIGVFPEEEKAYLFVSMMSWLLPLLMFVGALLDAFFVYIYMNFAHPWIDILSTGFSSTITFFDISVVAEGYGVSCSSFLGFIVSKKPTVPLERFIDYLF